MDKNSGLVETDFQVKFTFGLDIILQGVKFSGKDNIVFASGNMVVTMNMLNYNKSYFFGHKKKISVLTADYGTTYEKTNIIASGESLESVEDSASIIIWHSMTKEILIEMKHTKGYVIDKLLFHPLGNILMVISYNGSYYRFSTYNWSVGQLLTSENLGKCRIKDIKLRNSTEFVTVGTRHLRFWDYMGSYLVSSTGNWGDYPGEDLSSCEFCFSKSYCFIGTQSGNIGTWIDKKLVKSFQAHDGEVSI